jgi:spore germination cell wall hydrolase CwlJ-like protein
MDAEELRLLCNLIYFEARGCGDRHQQLVAAVALNRVADPRFPDTLFGVLTQPGQYGDGSYAWQSPEITPEIRANAEAALAGTVECPADVVFQAEFIQGSGIYEISAVDTGWWRSTTYFCRG